MKIGFFSIGLGELTNPEWVRAAATTAERVGFSTLWMEISKKFTQTSPAH
jgi:hypothetical protein